jgi:hypothetical protein
MAGMTLTDISRIDGPEVTVVLKEHEDFKQSRNGAGKLVGRRWNMIASKKSGQSSLVGSMPVRVKRQMARRKMKLRKN